MGGPSASRAPRWCGGGGRSQRGTTAKRWARKADRHGGSCGESGTKRRGRAAAAPFEGFEVEGDGLRGCRKRLEFVLDAKRAEVGPSRWRRNGRGDGVDGVAEIVVDRQGGQSPDGASAPPAARTAALEGPSDLRGRPLIRPSALPRPLVLGKVVKPRVLENEIFSGTRSEVGPS